MMITKKGRDKYRIPQDAELVRVGDLFDAHWRGETWEFYLSSGATDSVMSQWATAYRTDKIGIYGKPNIVEMLSQTPSGVLVVARRVS